MEFDHNDVRVRQVDEDRLSSLPDELIHQILFCFDMKFAVQTCLLSSRWKPLWTSMPFLNFSSENFKNYNLDKFTKFVTDVLSHRNHQVEVSSLKLIFHGSVSVDFLKKIAEYAFSHNVQELIVVDWPWKLFRSRSLKRLTLNGQFISACFPPETPWDVPALTTLHLSNITLCNDNTKKSVDIFSKCVNLKNLTLKSFSVKGVGVFKIVTPRLSNLTLINVCSKAINVIAPQLQNLTIIDCLINDLNAPPGISSLYYRDYLPMQLSKHGFHSLNKVSICLCMYQSTMPYKEEDARKTISMLQELHSAKHLTVNANVIECISSFPGLLSRHPSPFSNLICLTINSRMRKDAYKVKVSRQAKKFFLKNSPNATFITELPEADCDPLTMLMPTWTNDRENAKDPSQAQDHEKQPKEPNWIVYRRRHKE